MVSGRHTNGRGGRVLVVEDSLSDSAYIQASLAEEEGWTVDVVGRLADALPIAAGYDAVLLDLGLPDSSGLETLQAVREVAKDFAIVVLTGTEDPVLASEAIRLGAQDFVLKGESRAALVGTVLGWAVTREQSAGVDHPLTSLRPGDILEESEGVLVASYLLGVHQRLRTGLVLMVAEFVSNDGEYGPRAREGFESVLALSFRVGDVVARMSHGRYLIVMPDDEGDDPTKRLRPALTEAIDDGLVPGGRLRTGAVALAETEVLDLRSMIGLASLMLAPV